MSKRVFVKILIAVDTLGKITPKQITWLDGRVFQIDRVLDARPAPAKSGGAGIRYTCSIQGKAVPIYRDEMRGVWWCDGKDDDS